MNAPHKPIIKENYAVIPMSIMNCKDLTPVAKCVYAHVQSRPPDWNFSLERIASCLNTGVSQIRAACKNLMQHGVLYRYRIESGQYAGKSVYELSPALGYIRKPDSENRTFENRSLLNNIDVKNIDNINSMSESENRTLNCPKETPRDNRAALQAEFENEVWPLYPRKQGKYDAMRHYVRDRKRGFTKEVIISGLNRYIDHLRRTNTEPRFIKQGSAFFNQRCWMDEFKVSAPANERSPIQV